MVNKIKNLIKEDIFFITPDVKRGMGLEDILPNYHIICSYTDPIIPVLRKQGAKIFCLAENIHDDKLIINNSGKLLEHPLVVDYMKRNTQKAPWIMHFKPSIKLDFLIKKNGYLPIGNSARLNEKFENKINFFIMIHKSLPEYAIPSQIGVLGKLRYKKLKEDLKLPFVIQFGHGWAGKTTFFVRSYKEFSEISRRFSKTLVKVSKNIKGLTFLNNCCIYRDLVFISSPAIQLSGINKLCSKPSVTCGRQWPAKFLNDRKIKEIFDISQKIGKMMKREGFRGFFGLDFLVEKDTGRLYVSETNARLTASASFYARLEKGMDVNPLLLYHTASFLGKDIVEERRETDEITGSQVIFRESIYNPVFPASWKGRYGVYKFERSKPVQVREDYFPEKLAPDEFIYMIRPVRSIETPLESQSTEPDIKIIHPQTDTCRILQRQIRAGEEETARIEMKAGALDDPGKLKIWIEKLIVLQKKSLGLL